jgi:hypothetical protein
MPDFRRGAKALADIQERAKNNAGSFRPFTPSLFWSVDDERYLLFLNPAADITYIDKYIDFVSVPTKGDRKFYEHVIARTDPVIGEDSDPMVDDWEADPKEKGIAVAVELEPTFEEVKGRKRPVGFEVATTEYDRRIRDEKGDLTDETEEVVSPIIGFITQSPHNFFNLVQSFDAKEYPIEDTAVKISRVDKTTYTMDGYIGQEIDLSNLIDYIDGVSWLGEDLDDLLAQVDAAETDEEAAALIGAFFLDKRLAELVDEDRYKELYEGLDAPFRKFGGDKKDSKKKDRPKRERPARRSQRRTAEPEPEAESSPEPEAEAEAPAEEKPKQRRQRARKPAEPKPEPEAEAPAEDEKPKPSARKSGGEDKLAKLRERAAKRKAGAAA